MATNQITKARALIGALNVGRGQTLNKISKASATINHGTVAATTKATGTVTVTGAVAGDIVLAQPRTALATGITPCEAYVSAADTVTVAVFNETAAGVAQSGTWDIVVLKF